MAESGALRHLSAAEQMMKQESGISNREERSCCKGETPLAIQRQIPWVCSSQGSMTRIF